MSESLVYNLAVPSAALLKLDDASKLAFADSSWTHLNRYVGKVENLPAELTSGSAATGQAVDRLRSEANNFGSPRRLRQLLIERPNTLADAAPPPLLYASIVWCIQRLHASAGTMVSFLQALVEGVKSGEAVKEGFQLFGSEAQKARTPIGPLISSLKTFKAEILNAHSGVSAACKADAQTLRQMQETIGGLEVRVESVQKQIDELGFFSRGKKPALEQELQSLRQDLAHNSARAEQLRTALGKLEPILNEGFWLQSSVDNLVDFLDKLRKVWTTLGSGLAQLAVDSSDAQLGDAAWMEKVLGFDAAIKQWTAIDRAAKQFAAESLVDLPSD
jgi:hypothetical protein